MDKQQWVELVEGKIKQINKIKKDFFERKVGKQKIADIHASAKTFGDKHLIDTTQDMMHDKEAGKTFYRKVIKKKRDIKL